MKTINIFLGGNNTFRDNEEALSIRELNDNFFATMNKLMDRYRFNVADSSSIITDAKLKMESIIGKIMESHLCILDITSIIEYEDFVKYIEIIYRACIQLDKKMILLHHFAYPIDDWIKIARKENVLAVIEHDGKTVKEEEFSNCLKTFFEENQKTSDTIVLDDTNYLAVCSILNDWYSQSDVRGCYLHIFVKDGAIELHYQGYNTPTLFKLGIDVTQVSIENRNEVENLIKSYFQVESASDSIFYHDEKGKQIQKV